MLVCSPFLCCIRIKPGVDSFIRVVRASGAHVLLVVRREADVVRMERLASCRNLRCLWPTKRSLLIIHTPPGFRFNNQTRADVSRTTEKRACAETQINKIFMRSLQVARALPRHGCYAGRRLTAKLRESGARLLHF